MQEMLTQMQEKLKTTGKDGVIGAAPPFTALEPHKRDSVINV